MKTSKMLKILVMFLMVVTVIMSTTSVFAGNGDKTGIMSPDELNRTNTNADTNLKTYGGKILSAVTTAGVILSVIVLAVLGIKYMLGSAEEKAEYKKTLMPYIIGAALVFGASSIATIVYQFFLD